MEKNPANIMRLGNHGGRHSSEYHRAIRKLLDDADAGLSDGGREAAERALKEVFNKIDEGIANGILKPYINKDVWIMQGE